MGKTKEKSNNQKLTKGKPDFTQNNHFKNRKGKQQNMLTSKDKQKHSYRMKMLNKELSKASQSDKLKQERDKAKQEKEARIQAYKKKRLEKAKVLSKKTKRGQPLMNDRMKLLLKEIEKIKASS